MILHLLFPILLCTTPELLGQRMLTTIGPNAEHLIQTLPRTDSTYATLGMLLVNQLVLKETDNKRRKADSAVFFLRKARALCPDNPVVNAYVQAAIGLRANEDAWTTKVFGNTVERAHEAFMTMDSIRLRHPENVAVQFLSAFMFRDTNKKIPDRRNFQMKSYQIFQALHVLALEEKHPEFFTPDVYSQVLLSLAILVHTLESESAADTLCCQYISQLKADYPASRAAAEVHEKNLDCD